MNTFRILTRASLHAGAIALVALAACSSETKHPTTTSATAAATRSIPFTPPPAPKTDVIDEYHGVKVVDSYRWLEDWNDQTVKSWSDAQNTVARAYLDALPSVEQVRARVTQLETGASTSYGALEFRGSKLFALKNQPPKQQSMLVWMPSPNSPESEHIIVDPNTLSQDGSTAIDWFVPSFDGTLVAVSMSEGGSESGNVHIYETDSGKQVDVVIPRVNGGTAGGSLAWADNQSFYYTRYPRAGERPEEDMDFYTQVYFHKLGTPTEQDRYETGKDFPRIAEIMLESSHDGKHVLASVQKGDGGEFQHYLRTADGTWTQLTRYSDKCVFAALGHDAAYFVSTLSAPMGKVIKLPLTGSSGLTIAQGKVIIHESKYAIQSSFADREGLWPTNGRLYVQYQTGGPNELQAFDASGESLGALPSLPASTIDGVAVGAGDDILFRNQNYLTPPAWYAYDAAKGSAAKTKLFRTSPATFEDAEVVREWATSKDGTKVPMTILRRKGTKLNGANPVILWGYGGYGVCETPAFAAHNRVWLDQGGIFACANIRGGGEFGEQWHHQGSLAAKQNVFDDYYACAKHLIDAGYTNSNKLALRGGSNGGLLMGAALTQHPGVARAVISSVGIYDMLRVELTPNGAFNVPEFGTVKDPALFKAMYAYSPYHHVKDGTRYPSILFMTGANDPRVDPWHSRKMTARLQAAGSNVPGANPVLLRTSANAGHGVGSSLSQRIEQYVDMYSFLFYELDVNYKPVN